MKAFSVPIATIALLLLALSSSSCNLRAPNSHPGQPPAINALVAKPPIRTTGNVHPSKYGLPYLLEYARQQAGTTRPGAEMDISAGQLSAGLSAGRN